MAIQIYTKSIEHYTKILEHNLIIHHQKNSLINLLNIRN